MTLLILIVTTLIFVLLVIPSYGLMMGSVMLLISLSDPKQGIGLFDWSVAFVTMNAAISYRVAVLIGVAGSWLLYLLKLETLATLVSLLPLVNIFLFIGGISWIFGVVAKREQTKPSA